MTTLLAARPATAPVTQAQPREAAPPSADLLVIGAGVMGAWTAYTARVRGGRSVTLLDAYGVAHPRATSSDQTRIIRCSHGSDRLYARWARRSLARWREVEREWGVELFVPSGVLWFAHDPDGFEARSAAVLEDAAIPVERLDPMELTRRWPQLAADDRLLFALFEPESGALRARRACRAVVDAFLREGGAFERAAVRPGRSLGGRLLEVVDRDGRTWSADRFVFAAGPWLPRLFPDVLGDVIRVTKQDVLYLGPPAGDTRFDADRLPAWCDYEAVYYGIGAVDQAGMKIAPDRYGPIFDPSSGERSVDPESVRLARAYLRRRMPDMAEAPVVGTRVCQYETTPDGHFLIAPHPGFTNVWLVGGGSGHGFKHGPRIGEYLVARLDGAAEGEQDGMDEARFRIGPRMPGEAARSAGDAMARSWELF